MSELGKPFPKYQIKNTFKKMKINVKTPNMNKKALARKQIFVQTLTRSPIWLQNHENV